LDSAQDNGFAPIQYKQRARLKVSVAGGTEAERAQVRDSLAALTDLKIEVAEALASAEPLPNDVAVRILMVVLGEDPELWGEELRQWTEHQSWALVAAAVARRSADAVRHALRAGANEVLFLPLDPVDLACSLLKVSESHAGAGEFAGKAAYSLVSVAGGVGVSTLAVTLGLALQRLTRKRIALVDLGLQSSSLAAILDLDPQRTIGELIDPTSTIDSIRMETVISKHASGLYLLGAPSRIEDAEMVMPSMVAATITIMLQLFDFVLIDCGHHVSEGSVAAWEGSGNLLYVIDQSITSIRSAHRFLDLFERLHFKSVNLDFVLDRFRPNHPITAEKIESGLHRPVAFQIPSDEASLLAAAGAPDGLAGLPAASPVAIASDGLARALLGIPSAHDNARSAGILGKLRSKLRI